MQNVSGIKKWNYEKLPLNFAMQFPFPFPVIPGNNNVSFPFPKCGNGISIPVPKNWEWNFPVPVPKSWEWNFSFPFPFPKFGNGLSHSRSRSQMTKSHSRSPLEPSQHYRVTFETFDQTDFCPSFLSLIFYPYLWHSFLVSRIRRGIMLTRLFVLDERDTFMFVCRNIIWVTLCPRSFTRWFPIDLNVNSWLPAYNGCKMRIFAHFILRTTTRIWI